MVQIIEASNVLLENSGGRFETWLLKAVRGLYQHRLRESIAILPPAVTAEILAASQKILGPMGDISAN
jgi:hypothetical protein